MSSIPGDYVLLISCNESWDILSVWYEARRSEILFDPGYQDEWLNEGLDKLLRDFHSVNLDCKITGLFWLWLDGNSCTINWSYLKLAYVES